jgi:two-component system response regulator HydG
VTPLVLIVDDESPNLESLGKIFEREGWRVALAASGAAALDALRREPVAVVVTDLMMPGMGGEELLRAVKTLSPGTEVVLMTAYGTVETAVAAMKDGAYDFITKPVKRHAIVKTVRRALEKVSLVAENRALRARIAELAPGDAGGLIGDAPAFRAVLDTLRQAAPASANVLLVGESGTGKELAARLVHDLSPRAAGPFVPINCAAIPEGLLESELFGHEKGAFTGAVSRKEGRFERARGGTLFLDEVGEIPLAVLVKAAQSPSPWTSGWSRRRTRTSPRRRGRAASARTSSTGSTWCRSGCRRSATVARTCRSSRAPSSAASPRRTGRRSPASRPARSPRSSATAGQATSASCSTRSSAR